ncbi:MAG: RiPP maturation radical SAM C-methyltransferase [Gaiellaceae bacterium]
MSPKTRASTSEQRARRGRQWPRRVLLLSMPFAALDRPSLGLSLLKARLREDGVECDVRYPAFTFADFVGVEEYLWLHGGLPYTAFAGDWTFTADLYGDGERRDAAYLEDVLRRTWHLGEEAIARILHARAYCKPFLEHCVSGLEWDRYDVVGFTSTFEQNLASLALARRVKEAYPDKLILFGGANWEGEMGEELHRQFPFVDVVCAGEADESFPQLLAGTPPHRTRGVVFRERGRTVSTGAAPLVHDLDALPAPDYDDYFTALETSPAGAAITPILLLETSRGCWWGAKHHCTFCGLNGGAMTFRSKTAERALEEIHGLRERYGARMISVVDNILDMRYFKTLLPLLAEEQLDLNLFYEVKANLTLEQVAQLATAGVRCIQPGIESFSDHVLTLMRKGTTGLQNIQLLKWCREFDVKPEWNLLYGFPGETPSDYGAMLPLLDAIDFLQPPGAHGPVRLDRFSPYHSEPSAFGIEGIEPLAPYRYLYPFSREAQLRIAYYFDFEYADRRDPRTYVHDVLARVQRWMDEGANGGLWLIEAQDEGIVLLRDRRGSPREALRLDGWQANAYLGCDAVISLSRLRRRADVPVDEEELRGFLDWLVDHQVMLRQDDRYLALAVHSPPRLDAARARDEQPTEALV